jgi:outer membrane lipoprotein-sorting protein
MRISIQLAAFALLLSVAAGQPVTTQSASKSTTQEAATTNPAIDRATQRILEAMEAAGQDVKTVQADITYESFNQRLGDKEYRTGWVAYQNRQTVKSGDKTITKPPMFRVHFDTLRLGKGRTVKDPIDYAYDGKNLTIAKARTKTVTRFQLPRKNDGDNMFKLGMGPTLIPFGQKAEDMTKYFVCSTHHTSLDDTVYLRLVPRKIHAKKLNTVSMQIWINIRTHLPVKIITKDKSKNRITSTFGKTVLDKPVKQSMFTIPKPVGWKLIAKPLKKGQSLKP